MNLSKDDADLFFRLMWEVQFYVNHRLDILPGVESVAAYRKLSSQDKIKVRDALYKHLDLLDDFIEQNPAGLSADELQIVSYWKYFVAGEFFIVRYLKCYSVFIRSDKSSTVYGVAGLYDSLNIVLRGQPLPALVEAVLLPFKGRIVYDGLLMSRSILFGPGIRGDLNETYQTAKQKGEIIESLDPGAKPAGKSKPKKPARDWGPVLDGVVEATEQLKQADNVIQSRAFSVLKASARLAQVAAHDPSVTGDIAEQFKSARRAVKQMETALSRAGWYDWQ